MPSQPLSALVSRGGSSTQSTYCRPSGPRPWTLDWKRKRTHRVRRGRREVRPWPDLQTALNPLRAVLIGPGAGEKTGEAGFRTGRCPLRNKKRPPKGGFYVRSDNERLRGRDCSADAGRARSHSSRPSRRRERQQTQDRPGSISATATSAAAFGSAVKIKTSAPGSSRVSRRARSPSSTNTLMWRRIAGVESQRSTVPHAARPARLKSVHHIRDRLRLDLHVTRSEFGKERLQQGRQPDVTAGARISRRHRPRPTKSLAGRARCTPRSRRLRRGLRRRSRCSCRNRRRRDRAHRLCQSLTHHTEICAGLEAVPHDRQGPMQRPPSRERQHGFHACVWRIAALGVTVERQEMNQRVGVTGMGGNRKAKAFDGRPFSMLRQDAPPSSVRVHASQWFCW